MSRFPLGFNFHPKGYELMVYLSRKANGEQLPSDDFIKEIDLYHSVDLEKLLTIISKEVILYVFTKVKKGSRKGNGTNVQRQVSEDMFWRGLDGEEPIRNKAGCLVGHRRKFSLMSNMKGSLGYHMTEFVLDKKSLEEAKFKDYVVCKIKGSFERKPKKARRSIGIHGEHDAGFYENSSVTVLAPITPSDNTAMAASPTAASDSPINNWEYVFEGSSDLSQNSRSQYHGEQTLNGYKDSHLKA